MPVTKVLFDTDKYEVRESDGVSIVGEDGKYTTTHKGYVVVNKETGVIEHSTTMLPGAIFQAQHFNDTLTSLLSPPEEDEGLLEDMNVPEDVVLS